MRTIRGHREGDLAAAFEKPLPEVVVMEYLKKNKYATTAIIRDQFDMSLAMVRRVMNAFLKSGAIEAREAVVNGHRTLVYRLKTKR